MPVWPVRGHLDDDVPDPLAELVARQGLGLLEDRGVLGEVGRAPGRGPRRTCRRGARSARRRRSSGWPVAATSASACRPAWPAVRRPVAIADDAPVRGRPPHAGWSGAASPTERRGQDRSGTGEEVRQGPGVDGRLPRPGRPVRGRLDDLAAPDVERDVVDRRRGCSRTPEHQVTGRAGSRRRSASTARTAPPSSAAASGRRRARRPWSARSSPRRSGPRRPTRRGRRCWRAGEGDRGPDAAGGAGRRGPGPDGCRRGCGPARVGSGARGARRCGPAWGRRGPAAGVAAGPAAAAAGCGRLLGGVLPPPAGGAARARPGGARRRPRRRRACASSAGLALLGERDADVLQLGELGDQPGLLGGDRLGLGGGRGRGGRGGVAGGARLGPRRRRPAARGAAGPGRSRRPASVADARNTS